MIGGKLTFLTNEKENDIGQAKQRGTLKQRIEQALVKKQETISLIASEVEELKRAEEQSKEIATQTIKFYQKYYQGRP